MQWCLPKRVWLEILFGTTSASLQAPQTQGGGGDQDTNLRKEYRNLWGKSTRQYTASHLTTQYKPFFFFCAGLKENVYIKTKWTQYPLSYFVMFTCISVTFNALTISAEISCAFWLRNIQHSIKWKGIMKNWERKEKKLCKRKMKRKLGANQFFMLQCTLQDMCVVLWSVVHYG